MVNSRFDRVKKLLFITNVLFSLTLLSQSADYPLNHLAYQILDYQAAKGENTFFTKIKPYSRQSGIRQVKDQNGFNADYLRLDSREWSNDSTRSKKNLGRFLEYPADFYVVQSDGLDLHLNPVWHFRYGNDSRSPTYLYEFNRGVELRATIDKKIAVYTMISENQSIFPDYINAYRTNVGAVPQEGFWKPYGDYGTDVFRAEGYVDVGATDHISIQLGYGRHVIGDGQRSLILSDFGNRYPYVRIETEVWKFKYTNLFAQLVGEAGFDPNFGNLGSKEFPQKFLMMHHLDLNVTKNLNIGFFESVIFGEPDSVGGGVKLQYLNPIIFYRALEQQDGSPDNVLLGMDFNWHLWNTMTLYGQLVIDEMVMKEVFSGDQWWGNKQGYQLGAKYFNAFGVDRLMLQGELNAVRPYTYAHENFFTSYTHYNMPLAHPLGANFKEIIGKVDFQPFDKWRVQFIGVLASFGDDKDGLNYGHDISKPYINRRNEYGNAWLQGKKKNLAIFNTRLSYHLKTNLFLDGDFMLRELTGEERSAIFGVSFRWNFPERFYLF